MQRMCWNEYFLRIAKLAAQRSTCPKQSVGAVIVRDNRIIGTGYNGAPIDMEHCTNIGCKEDKDGHCIRSVHAEQNAVLQAMKNSSTEDAIIYCTHRPCIECCKIIIQAEISQIIYMNKYYDNKCEILGIENQDEFLKEANIQSIYYPLS